MVTFTFLQTKNRQKSWFPRMILTHFGAVQVRNTIFVLFCVITLSYIIRV